VKEPPQRAVPHTDHADFVRQAFTLLLNVETVAAVRNYLTSAIGRTWTTTEAKRLLTDERYLGVALFGQWRKEDAHPALVDRKTWEAVQNALRRCPSRPANGDSPFAYYLRGRVRCPHCGTPYTHLSVNRTSANRSKRLHYYVCSSAQKGRTKCPVTRINADALHYTLLHEIEHAAKHQTVMHRLIAESGGWQKADTALHQLRADVAKKKQFLGVQINNLNIAIAVGSTSFRSLLLTLESKEREEAQMTMELRELDEEIQKNTYARPEAKDVAAYWAEFVELWPELTDEEKLEMIGHLVKRIEVRQKNSIFLELAPVGGKCCSSVERKFLTTSKWERGLDLNQRPPGYEPDELPDCSTPRHR